MDGASWDSAGNGESCRKQVINVRIASCRLPFSVALLLIE